MLGVFTTVSLLVSNMAPPRRWPGRAVLHAQWSPFRRAVLPAPSESSALRARAGRLERAPPTATGCSTGSSPPWATTGRRRRMWRWGSVRIGVRQTRPRVKATWMRRLWPRGRRARSLSARKHGNLLNTYDPDSLQHHRRCWRARRCDAGGGRRRCHGHPPPESHVASRPSCVAAVETSAVDLTAPRSTTWLTSSIRWGSPGGCRSLRRDCWELAVVNAASTNKCPAAPVRADGRTSSCSAASPATPMSRPSPSQL